MHIPSTGTDKIEVLSFAKALEEAKKPQSEYDEKQWLYVPCRYEEYRYILGTTGKKPLICIGINPSTARPGELDNTLKSVERIAKGNGFDSFIMFNLYAQRATDPDSMEESLNSYLHKQNMEAFTYILQNAGDAPAVWAAWGAIIEKRAYLFKCAAEMWEIGKAYRACWYSCGKRSVKGHPHHPLYLKKDSALERFALDEYIENLKNAKKNDDRSSMKGNT